MELNRIELKPFEEKHLEATQAWVNDVRIMNLINRVLPVNMEQHQKWFQRVTFDEAQVIFAIEQTGSGLHVGNCGLKDIDSRSHRAELWIYLGMEHTGRGEGAEATRLLLDYGFASLNLNRIYLYALANNKPAINMFHSCGFKDEGIFRQEVFLNNCYHDTVHMSVLRDDSNKQEKGL